MMRKMREKILMRRSFLSLDMSLILCVIFAKGKNLLEILYSRMNHCYYWFNDVQSEVIKKHRNIL